MSGFESIEEQWVARLDRLRNVVRQHLIGEQMAAHVQSGASVLDVGCGQGTQAVRLAAQGHRVTGVDPSSKLLDRMSEAAAAEGCTVTARRGTVERLDEAVGDARYDVVCAHGLLMYLDDPRAALAELAARVRPGGLLSFMVRNGDALSFRPGLRQQWRTALDAFDATTYVSGLGVRAQAHRLDEVLGWCRRLGLEVERWYGVRVLSDGLPADTPVEGDSLDDCLRAELEAGRRDPYRRLGSQLHVVARKPSDETTAEGSG